MQKTQETWLRSLGQEDPLEKEMATHSRLEIPWTEEPEAGGGGGGVATVHGVTKESVKAQVWPQHEENHLLLQQHLDSCSIPGVSTHRLFSFQCRAVGSMSARSSWLSVIFSWPVHQSAQQRQDTYEFVCTYTDTQEMWVQSLGQEDPLEDEMATRSSILAWDPWTEEPGRL